MIKAIIVDDEPHARTVLRKLLGMSFPEVEIVGEAESLPDAVELIHAKQPNLVFMDIEMPNYSGLQIKDFIKNADRFEIIFVTAYNQYAINAIKLAAFDYLLKPLQINELTDTIERFKVQFNSNQNFKTSHKLEVLSNNIRAPENKKLLIQTHQGIHFFELNKVMHLEASGMYTIIHTLDEQFVASKPIKEFEQELGNRFFRVHRSYIVNCDFISKYSNKEGGVLTLSNGITLPIARNRKEEFLKFTGRN